VLIGASVGVVLAGGIRQQALPVIAIAAGSALLPDLDVKTSTASGWLRSAGALAGTVLSLGAAGAVYQRGHDPLVAVVTGIVAWIVVPLALSLLAPWRYLGHRGPFHSIPMALLVGFLAYLVAGRADVAIAVVAGWLSHLVADDLTHLGQPLLWPLSDRLVHVTPRPFRFRSGSWVEWPLSAGALLLVFTLRPPGSG
jgi:inner membrane protein